jgi:hypothetical protein
MGHHAQDLAMEALIDGRAPMNDKVPPQIAEWVTAQQAEKRTSPTGGGLDPQAATEAVTRAGPTLEREEPLVPEVGTDLQGFVQTLIADSMERDALSKAVKDGRAQINDYSFPDNATLRNVTLQTARIDGRSYARLLGTVSKACLYSEDAAGHLTAAHEINVTTAFVNLAKVTELHRVDHIEDDEEIRASFAHILVRRAKGWDDEKCRRRKGYEARVAAKRDKERAARLVEAEAKAELSKERARAEQWQLIALVLGFVIILVLVSHPWLIGL